jgi:hypothetical protein
MALWTWLYGHGFMDMALWTWLYGHGFLEIALPPLAVTPGVAAAGAAVLSIFHSRSLLKWAQMGAPAMAQRFAA